MPKEHIIKKYNNKILAVRNYGHNISEFFVDTFIDLDKLADVLDEVLCGESDITPAGKSFLEEYYGFDELEVLLQDKFLVGEDYSIKKWLNELEPMEISRFIEESRGTIQPGQDLRDDLMPPKVEQFYYTFNTNKS